eukprot:CAMPEP_0195101806 /NCGR_PEP_ID=MMETSP0448-20130528/65340_1 /TAXON_ID=66468 /ORGANISM="Heterocapsa triquestra, Strain CCMP 448" /LENGTH=64 /DNA_ID=CAMNT_0040137189 /DNA_START=136 /DNA_END=330 /DNA_ORIENTATION=+
MRRPQALLNLSRAFLVLDMHMGGGGGTPYSIGSNAQLRTFWLPHASLPRCILQPIGPAGQLVPS